MALFYWYTMTLFWSPATGAVAKTHLRVLMAIKSLYFTFSALQLRNGYPPPASYRYRLASSHPDRCSLRCCQRFQRFCGCSACCTVGQENLHCFMSARSWHMNALKLT